MTEHIRVVLVDDHHVVRQGLRTYLESFSDLEVVGESSSGEEALRHIELWLPDVVVMDLLMPGGMDGVETILTGGEAHSMRHIREAVARYGPNKVVNVYGPTECTTFATYHPLTLDALRWPPPEPLNEFAWAAFCHYRP